MTSRFVRPLAGGKASRIVVVLLPFLVFLFLCYVFFPETIDDSYITLRYAQNLLRGYGPVFNPGEHVEGYSNFAWMILMAALGTIVPMPIAMKCVSVVAGLCTIWLTGRMAREWLRDEWLVSITQLLLAASSFFAVWSVDGLETQFYTLLVTALLAAVTRLDTTSLQIGLCAGLVALTRPEGALLAAACLAHLASVRGLRAAFSASLPLVALWGGYEIFRLAYFGEFVPNTALAKLYTGFESVKSGLRYAWAFNRQSGYFVLPLALLGAIVGHKRPEIRAASAVLFAQLIFLAVSGGDFMFGYRFIVPVMPSLALLVAAALSQAKAKILPVAVNLAAATLIALVAVTQYVSLPPKHFAFDNLWFRDSPHFAIARYLASETTPDDSVLLSEAGIIPFGIQARIVDYLGLVSSHRLVYAPDRHLNVSYLFRHHPKFVVLTFVEGKDQRTIPRLGEDRQIFQSQEFQANYAAVKKFSMDANASFLDNIYYHYDPSAESIYFVVYRRTRNE